MFQVMRLIYFATIIALYSILIFMEVNELRQLNLVRGHNTNSVSCLLVLPQ